MIWWKRQRLSSARLRRWTLPLSFLATVARVARVQTTSDLPLVRYLGTVWPAIPGGYWAGRSSWARAGARTTAATAAARVTTTRRRRIGGAPYTGAYPYGNWEP